MVDLRHAKKDARFEEKTDLIVTGQTIIRYFSRVQLRRLIKSCEI